MFSPSPARLLTTAGNFGQARGSRLSLQALTSGVILALLFLPYPWSFLAPLPLAWLFGLIAVTPRLEDAFKLGFLAGLGFFAVHLLWLPVSFADLFGPGITLPMLILPPLLGVFWGVTAVFGRMTGRCTLLTLPFVWVVVEHLRSLGTLGFTWGTLGYAFLPTPIIQVADLGGVALVSLLVAWSAAALAAARFKLWWPVLSIAGVLLAAAGYGLSRPESPHAPTRAGLVTLAPAPDRNVLLVQGSVNPFERAQARSLGELELYAELSRRGLAASEGDIDLIVWPEGASPLPPTLDLVQEVLSSLNTPLILGAPTIEQDGFRNSAYGFTGGVTGRYDKVKLVPFGEFFPLRDSLAFAYDPLFAAIGLPGMTGALPGESYRTLELNDIRAGTYICYESAFSQPARDMARSGANLLVNISNDAWFGRTTGAEQHFQMGRVRAIETRRYVARAGNDGITAVIDPLGRVTQRFPRGERAAFTAQVALSDTLTPYVRWGDWVVGLSTLALLLLVLVTAKGGWRRERRD
ncbi:apolipoprotein N-acyltransferase [soil metagenome]